MERSDDRGGAPKTAVAVPPPLRPDATPVQVLRDRIRNASAAAAKRNSTLPPPPAPAGRSLSSPPEHSGVRSRPAERVAATQVSTSSLFAPKSETLRPPPLPRETTLSPEPSGKLTQLGLGAVVPTAPARAKKVTPDITTAKTQPMPRVNLSTTPPSAAVTQVGAIVPATPIAKGAPKTGPIKSPVPGLLRASQPATPREGRYSIRDVSAEYIEPRGHSSPPSVPPVVLRDDPPTPPLPAADDDDDLLSRSRRSTPKSRPARRRPTHLTRQEVAAQEEATAAPPPLPPRRAAAPTVEEHVPVEPPARAVAVAPPASPAPHVIFAPPATEPAVVVDPQLGAVTKVSKAPVANADRYTPLPSDRESFEAFMRERMKDQAHAQPGWSEQETKLISRDALRAKDKQPIKRRWRQLGALVVASACVAAGAWLAIERGQFGLAAPRNSAVRAASGASVVSQTLIVTEPAGAEIVVGGAVIGNTPSEVPRMGGDELYLLRLSGFESQLVRLTPHTRDVVRVTLKPLGMAEPPVAPPTP